MQPAVHDAAPIYRYRDTLAAVDCLAAAIVHLDLFTLLDREPLDRAAICRRLGIASRPTDVMLTLCAANGLLAADPAGIFRTTPLGREFLVAGAPRDARPYYASMAGRPGMDDWLKVLRTDRPANWPGEEGAADWHAAMRTTAFAESFTAAMDCRGRVLAPAVAAGIDLRSARRLLDVGGGSGVYAIACVEAEPALRATVLEAEPVADIARRTVARAGHGDRIDVTSADMFAADWPEEHDLHLFANVLHDWNESDCRRLLATSAARLPPGGRIIVADMFLDDAKDGPLWAAEYSVLLASVTQGRLYAPAEIAGWVADLGLAIVRHAPLPLGRGLLELARPASAADAGDAAGR